MPASPNTTPGATRTRPARQWAPMPTSEASADEEQAGGGGGLGVLARGVDEHGDGEDRAAATERAERQADEEPEGRSEQARGTGAMRLSGRGAGSRAGGSPRRRSHR